MKEQNEKRQTALKWFNALPFYIKVKLSRRKYQRHFKDITSSEVEVIYNEQKDK